MRRVKNRKSGKEGVIVDNRVHENGHMLIKVRYDSGACAWGRPSSFFCGSKCRDCGESFWANDSFNAQCHTCIVREDREFEAAKAVDARMRAADAGRPAHNPRTCPARSVQRGVSLSSGWRCEFCGRSDIEQIAGGVEDKEGDRFFWCYRKKCMEAAELWQMMMCSRRFPVRKSPERAERHRPAHNPRTCPMRSGSGSFASACHGCNEVITDPSELYDDGWGGCLCNDCTLYWKSPEPETEIIRDVIWPAIQSFLPDAGKCNQSGGWYCSETFTDRANALSLDQEQKELLNKLLAENPDTGEPGFYAGLILGFKAGCQTQKTPANTCRKGEENESRDKLS